MIESLDHEAARLSFIRQSIIKVEIAERLEQKATELVRVVRSRQPAAQAFSLPDPPPKVEPMVLNLGPHPSGSRLGARGGRGASIRRSLTDREIVRYAADLALRALASAPDDE